MIKGSIYATNDIGLANNMSSTNAIICISGETHNYQDFIQNTNASVATVLLPPYEAVMAEMDGMMQDFEGIYYSYLDGKQPTEFISIIIKAIMDGKNILLYLTPSESKLSYINYFMKYMFEKYGILIGTSKQEFSFNPNYIPIILSTIYLNNLISGIEFLMMLPDENSLGMIAANFGMVLDMLLKELNPFVIDKTPAGYFEYLVKYRQSLINSGGKKIPVLVGGFNDVASK